MVQMGFWSFYKWVLLYVYFLLIFFFFCRTWEKNKISFPTISKMDVNSLKRLRHDGKHMQVFFLLVVIKAPFIKKCKKPIHTIFREIFLSKYNFLTALLCRKNFWKMVLGLWGVCHLLTWYFPRSQSKFVHSAQKFKSGSKIWKKNK